MTDFFHRWPIEPCFHDQFIIDTFYAMNYSCVFADSLESIRSPGMWVKDLVQKKGTMMIPVGVKINRNLKYLLDPIIEHLNSLVNSPRTIIAFSDVDCQHSFAASEFPNRRFRLWWCSWDFSSKKSEKDWSTHGEEEGKEETRTR